MFLSSILAAAAVGLASAQDSTFSPLRPPAIPLAVKSPYMSTWQQAGSDGGNGGYLPGEWPTFWNGPPIGWTGIIRVDNSSYTFMGNPRNAQTFTNQTAFSYTSTRSIFTMTAGPVQVIVTFLSGVTPDDLMRSSLPYSYMNVDVHATDGRTHSVQLYSDISAEWVSGDRNANAQWSYGNAGGSAARIRRSPSTTDTCTVYATQTSFSDPASVAHTTLPVTGATQGQRPVDASNQPHSTYSPVPIQSSAASSGVAYHKVFRQQQLEFGSINEQAEWGNWYYSTASSSSLTYQSGADDTVRGNFIKGGNLPNTQDTHYRPINNAYPVFGFASDLGRVGSDTQSVLYQISLHQRNCVQFEGQKNSVSKLPCLWTNYFSDDTDALSFFYNDYPTARSIADSLDSKVSSDSKTVAGSDYVSLTSLATRQAFGALEYANTPSQPLVFMKEISSDGNVNTVDVIMPFHPIAIYFNSTILKYLLDPLFINQESGNWPNAYSIHDIGSAFPNATGHNDGNDEAQPLEECGNMLIMTLAYAQRNNDNSYLSQHYSILKQWTGYLVQEALYPQNQISTDDFAGAAPNQTNLAIKGIIGIQAMASIANRTGHASDAQNYSSIAARYLPQWQRLATDTSASPPHTIFNYNNASTFSLLYNLFADAELQLDFVPQSVYNMQSTFYNSRFDTYGVPLDSRHTYSKADWEIWCAAIASSDVRAKFVSILAKWLNQTPTNYAFTDWYDTVSGNYPGGSSPGFIARPAVGGMFAPLVVGR